jgi:6-phosphogluconolactonase (cycloisomerase 2 family)
MKLNRWVGLMIALATVLTGCDGFWDQTSGSSGSGGSGTASGIFYVLNQKTAQVTGFSFAAGSTSLGAVSGSPYTLGAEPLTMAISPNGGFLYISTLVGIYAYRVDSTTGALTLLNNNNAISADPASTMVVDPTGSWLIEAISGVTTLNAISLDQTTGIVLSGTSEQTVSLPSGATAVPQVVTTRSAAANPYVFVAMNTSGVATIPFNSASSGNPFGAVTTISPKSATGGDTAVAIDLTNQILYVGETAAVSGSNSGGLRMFNIESNSTLAEVSGSPYSTGGIVPSAILPAINYVFVANKSVAGSSDGNITDFAITTTGTVVTLTTVASGTVSTGGSTASLAEESTGTYILAVNSAGSPDLNAYTIGSTGALTTYATGSTGSDPVQAVVVVAIP